MILLVSIISVPKHMSAINYFVVGGDNWKKCRALAMVIATCPAQASSVEQYYSHVCPQVSMANIDRQMLSLEMWSTPCRCLVCSVPLKRISILKLL